MISATVTIDDAKATEGKSITFTVTLDKAVPGGLKVTPSFTDGTATKGTDYTATTAALDFVGTAGESVSFTVPTIDDTEGELDETFTVGLSVSGTSHTVTATDTATGTIKDNEEVTAQWWFGARLSVSPGTVSENGGKQKVTVTAEVSEWGTSTSDLIYVVTVGKGGDSAVSGTGLQGRLQVPRHHQVRQAVGQQRFQPGADRGHRLGRRRDDHDPCLGYRRRTVNDPDADR